LEFGNDHRPAGRHAVGIGAVVLMHLLLGWALVSGLAQRMVEVIKAPIETKIIEETKPPEPPPPENLPPPPKFAPPPPSFVPPPEVVVNPPPTPAPTITTTQVAPPPAPVTIAPPPSPVQAPPAPPAPPPPPAPPKRTEPRISFDAETKPEYPRAAQAAGIECTVVVAYTMETTGSISEAAVERSCGPTREHKLLDRVTLEAVRSTKGTPGTLDGKPEKSSSRVTYVWKIAN